MAASTELNIFIRLRDEASAGMSKISGSLKAMEPQFKSMAIVGGAAFAGISAGLALSLKEAMKNEAAQNRLSHILKTATKATDEQIKSLFEQAKALEKVGVVSADAVIQAQGQLATFDLSTDAIKRLTPAILDYVVAEKGASASTEDLKQLTNGLAQALQGNFASLTRTGFVLDDATKELIKNGTEAERTAALVKVLNSTYEGFNAAARDTAEGGLKVLQNEMNNLLGTIGDAFIPLLRDLLARITPIVEKVAEWIKEHPELSKNLILVAAGVSALLLVVGTLGLVLPSIIAGFSALGAVAGFIAAHPLVALLAILGALILVIKKQMDAVGGAKEYFKQTWEGIKIIFKEAIDSIIGYFQPLIDTLNRVRDSISRVTSGVGQKIGSVWDKITPFATGGIVTKPTLGMVGEAGPEAIIPLSQLGRFGGGMVINITGNYINDDLDVRDLADRVGRAVVDKLNLNQRVNV